MKCTCDSRDLFNFGCRCNPDKLVVDKLDDIGSMHPSYLLSPRGLHRKVVSEADLLAAFKEAYPKDSDYVISGFVRHIWEKLK